MSSVQASSVSSRTRAAREALESPDPVYLRNGLLRLIESHLAANPHFDRVPGACVALGIEGLPITTIPVGLANRELNTPVTPETVFRACSMTKAATAAACLRLVDRGYLSLDAPIADFLPEQTLPESQRAGFDWRKVTLRRVLSHTAGFNVFSYDTIAPGAPSPTAAELIGGVMGPWSRLELTYEPGSSWSYSGGGYTLLRLLLEAVTGRDVAQVFASEVFIPAKMTSSTLIPDDTTLARLATGHDNSGAPIEYRPLPDLTASGMFTTAPDLARLWLACMPGPLPADAPPTIISEALAAEMTRDQREVKLGQRWGLGYQIDSHKRLSIYRHAGCRPGWWGHAEGHPRSRTVLVTLSNSEQGNKLLEPLIGKVRRFLSAARPPR